MNRTQMLKKELVAKIHLSAAAIIGERGLYKGHYIGPNGAVCIAGATNLACDGPATGIPISEPNEALDEVGEHIFSLGIEHVGPDFNDAPSTTQEDVVVLLHLLAHDAKNYWEPV